MKNKTPFGLILLLICLTFPQLIWAGGAEHAFTYTGEPVKTFSLKNELTETRYRTETYQDTCTRQVPYTENVCGNETRYRTECQTIPGHEECRNVPDRECHSVTRYREECHTEPGRPVCHHEPGRQVCHNEPGRQVCTNRPDREECHIENGRRICRRVPGGRECHNEPGRQVCHNEPGREVCHNEPGRRICQNVPYTDTECRDTTRRVCEWEPARQDCRQVAYQEYVCRDVTRYRTETYACTQSRQVPYTVTLKTFNATVDFKFTDYNQPVQTKFMVALDNQGKMNINVKDESDPSVFVQLEKKVTQSEANDVVSIKAIYNVHFIDKSDYTDIFEGNYELVDLNREKAVFRIGDMNHPDKTSIALKFMQDEKILIDRVLTANDFETEIIEHGTLIKVNLTNLDIQKFWGKFSFDLKVSVTLPENIVDLNNNVLSKEQSLIKVIAPPYEILHRVIKLSDMKQLAKKSFLSDMTQYKNKIRSKTIGLFRDAGFNVEVRIETINYNKKDHSGSFELTLEKELSNEKIIEIFAKKEVSVNI